MITGAARGLGNAIARAALNMGDKVVALTRRPMGFAIPEGHEDDALCLQLDVSSEDMHDFEGGGCEQGSRALRAHRYAREQCGIRMRHFLR